MTLKPEHIVEELNRTPKLKRDLIMKMMEVMVRPPGGGISCTS